MSHSPKALLDSYEILPKKSLGQNFMHDPNALVKIVASAEPSPDDTVVEVGAGTGALTDILAGAARSSIQLSKSMRACNPCLKNALMIAQTSTSCLKTS